MRSGSTIPFQWFAANRQRYEDVLRDLRQRDENDRTRAVAPLVPAPDAVEIDTTGNTLEQSFAFLYKTIKERLAQ